MNETALRSVVSSSAHSAQQQQVCAAFPHYETVTFNFPHYKTVTLTLPQRSVITPAAGGRVPVLPPPSGSKFASGSQTQLQRHSSSWLTPPPSRLQAASDGSHRLRRLTAQQQTQA